MLNAETMKKVITLAEGLDIFKHPEHIQAHNTLVDSWYEHECGEMTDDEYCYVVDNVYADAKTNGWI